MVNVSSAASVSAVSFFGPGLDFATFKDSPHRRKWESGLYGQSKFVRHTTASGRSFDQANIFQPTRGMSYSLRNLPGGMVIKS